MMVHTSGSLEETSFIDILKDAAQFPLTGMIRAENGPIIKVIYFQKGSVSFASSNEKSDRLTEVLKRAGKLTPEQVTDAQSRLKPNVSLGKTLVELGYISPRDLLWGARAQVDGILHHLLFWKQGKYQVIHGNLPKEIIHLNLNVPAVIFEGIMTTQNRDWILQHIGSPEAIYATTAEFDHQVQNLKLPVSQAGSKLNGRRSLHDIAQSSGIDTFELCKTVVALQYLDLVRPIQDEPLQIELNAPEFQEQENVIVEDEPFPSEVDQHEIPATENPEREERPQITKNALTVEATEIAETEKEKVLSVDPEASSQGKETATDVATVTEAVPHDEPSHEQAQTIEPVMHNDDEEDEVIEPREPDRSLFSRSSRMERSSRSWLLPLAFMLAGLVAAGMYFYFNQTSAQQETAASSSITQDPISEPTETATEVEQVLESQTPLPDTPDQPSDGSPLSMLRNGRLADAAQSWQSAVATGGYSIQILIACQEKTVQETFAQLNYSEELMVIPMTFRGQGCYRVLFGQYSSRRFAEKVIQTLPEALVNQASPATVVALSRVLS